MPAPSTDPSFPTVSIAAFALTLVLCGGLAVGGWFAANKVQALPGMVLPATRPAATAAKAPPPTMATKEAGPTWTSLTSAQQLALEPLQPHWSTLTEAQKRKWISLAAGFQKLSAANQERVHNRMIAWAALTPQQRNRARLNFAETRKITAPAKQEQWDAYQALSDEAKQALAERAARQPQGAAVAVRPVPGHKFARVPAADGPGGASANPPKILPPVVDMVPVPVPGAASAPLQAPATPGHAPAHTEPISMPSSTTTDLPPLADMAPAAAPDEAPGTAAEAIPAIPTPEPSHAPAIAPAPIPEPAPVPAPTMQDNPPLAQ